MYRMMWGYLFPEEEQDSQRRQEVWKVSTTAGAKRHSCRSCASHPMKKKKVTKSQEEKRSRPRKMMEFHNIKISQVELCVTYEGSRFVVNDLKLLMDTFHRVEFTGTWRRLFSRVKKHIIWGVLNSVTGMQGKKFKDNDNEGQPEQPDQNPITFLKRPSDGAGDGFVTSIRGLFNTQRRKAKAFVLRTMRGEAENDFQGDWNESDAEFSPLARQLTITKAKRLIRRQTKNFRSRKAEFTFTFSRLCKVHPHNREIHSHPRQGRPLHSRVILRVDPRPTKILMRETFCPPERFLEGGFKKPQSRRGVK
ncbi:hypothetical protein C1H46_032363 [Malus baccata]|uniref:Uncharacterized protein n=1 Tax=Malus baccata TaxID=106549 RepID=A0A540L6I1_MALBA|nr:hypothetical protein C1H46_032363 [Malus baccata]